MAIIAGNVSGPTNIPHTTKEAAQKRVGAMKTERTTFEPHWKDMAKFIRPRRGRFFIEDRNKGGNRYSSIINSAGTFAHRTATAGMFSGTASPARPWFRMITEDPELMDFLPVQAWIQAVEKGFRSILSHSNFYNMYPTMLGEMILFGTGCMSHLDDPEDISRFYTHTAGSYYLGQDDRQEVNTFAREYELTVSQLFEKFGNRGGGANNMHISATARTAYDNSNYDQWVPVTQLIQPNELYKPNSRFAKNFKFASLHYEHSEDPSNENQNKFLEQSGFRMFPVYAPRWEVTGEDIYGTDSPAMVALGDIKQLQTEERRKAQAIDKMVNPVLHGPPSLQNVPLTGLPGGSNIYDAGDGKHKLAPVYQVDPRLNEMRADMDGVERRIDKAFFVELFLAISNMEGVQPRNQLELSQRNQERLLQLGPVLERIQGEMLELVINRLMIQASVRGLLPEVPPELEREELDIKFVGTLAQAQEAVATGALERTFEFAGALESQGFQGAAAKLKPDEAVDEFAKAVGAPTNVIKSDEELQAEREAAAQRQRQAEQLQMAQVAASAAKDASGVNVEDESTLTGAFTKRAREASGVPT